MRVYLDTNVLVYAIGGDSSQRRPCQEILRAVAAGQLTGETSIYTIQEFVRQRMRRADTEATPRARQAIDLFADVHPVDGAVVQRAIEIVEGHPGFDIGDAVHVATALTYRLTTILSADRGLDRVAEIERVDPLDRARLAGLITE